MADLALLKAIEAGVDIVDTCMSPYAYRSSHPAIEPLVVTLLGTNRDTGLNVKKLADISNQLEKVVPKYMHYLNQTKLSIIDTNVLLHQTPGGMLSNLVNQLKQMGELDKLDDVFKELPKVRKDLGQVPLVTPTSQIVGTQTVNNVLFDKSDGEDYSKITEQVKDLCFGLYGKTPKPINPEIQKRALKNYPRGEKPITVRPGEILEHELEKAKDDVKELAKHLDDTLIYALFPVTGKRFLKWKYGHEPVPNEVKPKTIEDVEKEQELIQKALSGELVEKPKKEAPEKPEGIRSFDVYVDGDYFKVEVNDPDGTPVITSAVNVQKPAAQAAPVQQTGTKSAAPKKQAVVAEGEVAVTAPLPGMIVSYEKKKGDSVETGETIVVIEAMKMNNNIEAPCDGKIKEILHDAGSSVAKEDILCIIEP
jgi:pyruvate carboxylase